MVGTCAHEVDRALVRAGGAIAALGPLLSGALLTGFDWGSVFIVTLPLAVVALYLALRNVPAHVNETTDPVENLGGILSVSLVAAILLGAVLILFLFPKKDREEELVARYHAEDVP